MTRNNKLSYSDNSLSQIEDIALRCFFPEAEEMTIKQIRERCGYSYERVHNALKKLEEKRIVKLDKKGKTLLFKANYNHLYLKLAFYHYMTERLINFSNKHTIIYNALKEIDVNSMGIVLIFGSYSKETQTKNSDIDLMIVSNSKNTEKEINNLKIKYGLNVSLALIKSTEFPKIKKENKELWDDLKNYALIFNRSGLFYYWMYQNESN